MTTLQVGGRRQLQRFMRMELTSPQARVAGTERTLPRYNAMSSPLKFWSSAVFREFSPIQAAVDAIARGEVIIVVDAEDRENEGDFICAAEKATAELVNFILSGRGEFCAPLLPDAAARLDL